MYTNIKMFLYFVLVIQILYHSSYHLEFKTLQGKMYRYRILIKPNI